MNKRQKKKALKRNAIAWIDFPPHVFVVIPHSYSMLLYNLTWQRMTGKRKKGKWTC